MLVMNTLRTNQKLREALIVAVGLLVSAGIAAVALAQNEPQDKTPYRSSIQVPRDRDETEANEENEAAEGREAKESDDESEAAGGEAEDAAEKAESARYQSLARITSAQASAAAVAKVRGKIIAAVLENEDGNLVYGVEIRTTAGEQDVKVDAGNGAVLHVEKGDHD